MHKIIQEILPFSQEINLLYVEDSLVTRTHTEILLRELFPKMRIASDGQEALTLCENDSKEEKIDLLITDIEMPRLDGLTLTQRLKAQNPELSVLVTSAHEDNSYLQGAIALGVDGYIIKPFVLDQFYKLLLKTSKNLYMREENRRYKLSLEAQVSLEIANRKDKEKLLMQQAKMAAMGDMIDAIAHQWKQPLNAISLYMQMLYLDAQESKTVAESTVKEYQENIDGQVQHLLNTLHEFRDFFKTDKVMRSFSMRRLIESVLLLMKDELLGHLIETQLLILSEDDTIFGSENELKHLLINLINNAKDAFNEKQIKHRSLLFLVSKKEELRLEVEDNAGGIDESLLDKIFQARITTKEEGKGSGIGLYMSQQIVDKHQGRLWVENVAGGAKFIATFPLREGLEAK